MKTPLLRADRLSKCHRDRFLLAVVVFCLFSFKIILLPIGEAGIRADDLLIFSAFVWLVFSGRFHRVRFSKAFQAYFVFQLVGIISALWNGVLGRVGMVYSLVFVVRQFEYLVFFCFGFCLAGKSQQLSRAFLIYAVVLAVVVPGQMLGIVPVPGDFGSSRASGNTNGPYELAAVAAFLMCYLGYGQRQKLSGFLAFLFIVLSAARITFIGAIVSLLRRLLLSSRKRLVPKVALLATMCIGALVIVFLPRVIELSSPSDSPLLLTSRLATSSYSLIDLKAVYDAAPVYRTSQDYVDDMFDDALNLATESSGDVSGMIRAYRWTTLLKTTLSNLDSIIVGVGPSFGTAAVDGYFVRVFVETGFLGLATFAFFLWALFKGNFASQWSFREYVLILTVTACFIDIFVSYKPMLLLWLWHGMNQNIAVRRKRVELLGRRALVRSKALLLEASEQGASPAYGKPIPPLASQE